MGRAVGRGVPLSAWTRRRRCPAWGAGGVGGHRGRRVVAGDLGMGGVGGVRGGGQRGRFSRLQNNNTRFSGGDRAGGGGDRGPRNNDRDRPGAPPIREFSVKIQPDWLQLETVDLSKVRVVCHRISECAAGGAVTFSFRVSSALHMSGGLRKESVRPCLWTTFQHLAWHACYVS